MKKLKKLGVLSVGLIYMLISAVAGLLLGLFYAAFGGIMAAMGGQGAGMMAGMGAGMIILGPILYGIIGFISGVIGAVLYNLFAKWTGGIEVELQ